MKNNLETVATEPPEEIKTTCDRKVAQVQPLPPRLEDERHCKTCGRVLKAIKGVECVPCLFNRANPFPSGRWT